MLKISRKALPGLVVILAMLLGAWSAPMALQKGGKDGDDRSNGSTDSTTVGLPSRIQASASISYQNKGSLQLSGVLAQVSNAQSRIDELNAYKVNFSAVSNQSEFDKQFVEDSLTSNSLEIWTMQYAVRRVQDANLRNLIQMMIAMHTQDQQTSIQIAQKLGIDTSVDFTNASVYPETPDYDLGMRTENLQEHYLDPLVEKSKQSFDDRVLSILEGEHTSDVQGELSAERLIVNPELKAFAKHSADVTELHLSLLDVVHSTMQQYDESQSPDFQTSYMAPRNIHVEGQSTSGVTK